MNVRTSSGSGSVAAAARLAAAALRSAAAALTRRQAGLVRTPWADELPTEVLDGVDRAPGLLLLARAVLVARVGEGVAVVAVGGGLDEHGALAGAAELRGTGDRVTHRQHVHAVDDLGVHAVVGEAGAAQGQVAHAHDLVVGAMGHAVVVVLDEEDDGQPALPVAGQEVGPLVLRARS